MIIKSKVLSFGFGLSLFMLLIALTSILFAVLDLVYHLNRMGILEMPIIGIIWFFFVMFIVIAISLKLLWDANILEIDSDLKTIKFTNRITWFSSVYNLNYFDCSIIVFEPIKGGYARNYYLLKDRKVIKRIDGLIYSNQSELEIALSEIKSMGEKKYSYLNSAKILFGLPILDKNFRE
jgi:hypothetical protein